MIYLSNKPPVIERGNARMNKLTIATAVGMFLYGLLLPTNWEELLGPLAWPISWAAQTAPATMKVAQLSPIPELVRGFYGMVSWVVILFAVSLAVKDPIGERVKFAFTRPGASAVKTALFVYLIFVPLLLACIWVAYCMPIKIDMTGGYTWGGKLLVEMITSRFSMSFFGSIATVGLGLITHLLIVAVLGPFTLLVSRESK